MKTPNRLIFGVLICSGRGNRVLNQKNKIEISGLKILKIVIKMGFKSATQSLRRGYRINNLIFPSKQVLSIKY